MRFLILLALTLLVSACASGPGQARVGRIMVVDALGVPLPGALVQPEQEDERYADPRKPDRDELNDRTSDAKGVVYADMKYYYWATDDCFHFNVTKAGYEDATFSVSRELFPAVLKIRREAVAGPKGPKPAPNAGPSGR